MSGLIISSGFDIIDRQNRWMVRWLDLSSVNVVHCNHVSNKLSGTHQMKDWPSNKPCGTTDPTNYALLIKRSINLHPWPICVGSKLDQVSCPEWRSPAHLYLYVNGTHYIQYPPYLFSLYLNETRQIPPILPSTWDPLNW